MTLARKVRRRRRTMNPPEWLFLAGMIGLTAVASATAWLDLPGAVGY